MPTTHELWTSPAPETMAKPRAYTEEQLREITALREYARTIQLPPGDPYHIWEDRWLDWPDCCGRYMRAAKWKFEDAKRRIRGTLEWRREYKPDLIKPEDVKIESETGKIVITGFDMDQRPIIYMRPGNENTSPSPRQILHLIFVLERTIEFMLPEQDSLVIIVDYASCTLRSNPSIGTARKVLNILQNHYVERLGRAIVVNLPMLLNFFYKGISPFLDPVTKDKMRFNPDLLSLVPKEQLDSQFGGDYEYEFEPESYWKQVLDHCGVMEDGTRKDFPPRYTNKSKNAAPITEKPDAPTLGGSSEDTIRSSASSSSEVTSNEVPSSQTTLDDPEARVLVDEKTLIRDSDRPFAALLHTRDFQTQ